MDWVIAVGVALAVSLGLAAAMLVIDLVMHDVASPPGNEGRLDEPPPPPPPSGSAAD